MRMKLPWLANARPDCSCDISTLAKVIDASFDLERTLVINKLNKFVK